MEAKILEFAGVLRDNGLSVSPAETLDAFATSCAVGLSDRTAFKAALRATMVKRAVDIPTFDSLFDLYFSGLGEAIKQSTQSTARQLELDPAEFQAFLEELQALLEGMEQPLSALAQALLSADNGRLEQLLRAAGQQSGLSEIQRPFQQGQHGYAAGAALGLGALEAEIEAIQQHLNQLGLSEEVLERAGRFLAQRLDDLRNLISRMVGLELEQRDLSARESGRMQALAEKSFYYLTEDEIRRMNEAVTKLAQRLKNAISVKRRRQKRGRFDVKATLRKNLQYGGVPFRLRFDDRRREKPRVVILCDVSDSVRNVSRFMLQFVYSLQELYSKVRSFIFVSELGEVTQLFEDNPIHEGLDLALRGNVINVYAHSDFGRAFRTFHREYLSALNRRTTVIILGDARNNYNVPHEWVVRDIQRKAKQVIWLNPENKMTWGFGDSEMDRYAPHCTMVEECRNLNQLYRVVDRIVTV
jgi:uncharacterized protein with von Willebrand factor type A (vWA) domain